MKLWMLGSGSRGNAVLIESGDERILVDAGFGPRALARRLRLAGAAPESVTACFLTHEHSDHIGGVMRASTRWGWAVHATRGTLAGEELSGLSARIIEPGGRTTLVQLDIDAVRTPHDARDSVGFVITERATGARAAIFTDIGHASASIASACADVDILVIESNHDSGMLRAAPYPPWLQARIAGDVGHLSNRSAAELVTRVVGPTMSHVVLAHLSEQCNHPQLAMQTTSAVLRRTRFRGRLTASSQDSVAGPFVPRRRRGQDPGQMELF